MTEAVIALSPTVLFLRPPLTLLLRDRTSWICRVIPIRCPR